MVKDGPIRNNGVHGSDGNSAFLRLKINPNTNCDVEMVIDGNACLSEKHKSLIVTVIVNGRSIGQLNYKLAMSGGARTVKIPGSIIHEGSGILNVKFLIDKPISPLELGICDDQRKLGLGLISLSFR